MLSVDEHNTLEDASVALLEYVLAPEHWVTLSRLRTRPHERPGQNPAYQRRVGNLRICASVDITDELDVYLRIAFRAPGLTPTRAADHLAEFMKPMMPLTPNSEWQVLMDDRGWVHFMRRWVGPLLAA